jgi:hypothetical protein
MFAPALLALLCVAGASPGDPPAPENNDDADADANTGDAAAAGDTPWTWQFGGLPALGFDADNGVLVGAIGNVYFQDGETEPYRLALQLQILITHKLVQDHALKFDALKVGGLPLRLTGSVGWSQSLTQNYCGQGLKVTCDDALAEAEADRRGLDGSSRDDFVRRFYLHRFMNPFAGVTGRWAFTPLPHRIEAFGGWRGSVYIPGTWADDDGDGAADTHPYPGSFYERDFPEGEGGFASVVQAGVMLDTRDNEPSPRRGFWLESSMRAATSAWGSSWNWAGANATARVFLPILDGEAPLRLTLANRLVFDAVVGDIPIQELVRPGGFTEYLSFGGADMGRGIRVQRYVGKLKVFGQSELRWRFVEWQMFGSNFALSTNGIIDVGYVGVEVFDQEPGGQVPFGVGGAVLFHWNENFMLRVEVATSAIENYGTSVYITLGQSF